MSPIFVRPILSRAVCCALVLTAFAVAPAVAHAQGYQHPVPQQDLFYNFYVDSPTGNAAAMYVSPRPTPEMVGHTWVTYQPLMPHEFLHPHHRTYYAYNPGSGMTQTKVWWCHAPFVNFFERCRLTFNAPRPIGFTNRTAY